MTPEELQAIEVRLEATVKRPVHMTQVTQDLFEVWKEADVPVAVAKFYHEPDAIFFCEALKDVRDLIAEIRRLHGELTF